MSYPFFYLQSSELLHLKPRLGAEIKLGQVIKSMKKLLECYINSLT